MTGPADVSDFRAVLSGALAQNRLRTAIAVLAIALGVALGFGVQLINGSAVDALSQSVRTVSGDADVVVRGAKSGFDEVLFVRLAQDPDVAVASPAVEVEARIAGRNETLRVVGLDLFRAAAIAAGAGSCGRIPVSVTLKWQVDARDLGAFTSTSANMCCELLSRQGCVSATQLHGKRKSTSGKTPV